MNKANKVEAALETLQAAEAYHAKLVSSKFAAIGKAVGMFAPELAQDGDLAASHKRCQAAQRAYSRLAR